MSGDIQPKTLLEMAGAIAKPATISDSAIVLIDCQKEYLSGALPLHGIRRPRHRCADCPCPP